MMYGKEHQLFLSYILRRGCVQAEKALDICKTADIRDVTDINSLKRFISAINRRIDKHSLQILIGKCEVRGDSFVILNDMANDDISKLQTSFKPLELEYFQAVLKEIVYAEDRRLTQINCLNISSTLSSRLSIGDAEVLLDKWAKMGYFVLDDTSMCLGIRCISEFAPYFQKYCKDYIKSCGLCSEIVFSGKTCNSCKETMHFYCVENFSQQEVCPNCKKTWDRSSENVEETSSEED